MAEKKVIIGYVDVMSDTTMENREFQYAASFETLKVPKGRYPIYAYYGDLRKDRDGQIHLGWRNYIGYKGTVLASNVGGKVGEKTHYHPQVYDYILADYFIKGRTFSGLGRFEYQLEPEWDIELYDFISDIDGRRVFSKNIVLKDGSSIKYLE